MLHELRRSFMVLLLLTLLTGVAYPLVVTGISSVAFPDAARGSLLRDPSGRVVGSRLIGQPFDDPAYFWGRPSATAPFPCNPAASSGSNLATSNPALREAVEARAAALRGADPHARAPIPIDLVTASGSGLDPHVSPAAAAFQVGRVARARGLDPARVRALVAEHTEGRDLGFLGEPRVNVLELNLALDRLAPRR